MEDMFSADFRGIPAESEVWDQVDRLAASQAFAAKRARCIPLLRYLIELKLKHAPIESFSGIALTFDYFKRKASSKRDPLKDSAPRVYIHDLREGLKEFYAVGADSELIVIEIPISKSEYIPSWRYGSPQWPTEAVSRLMSAGFDAINTLDRSNVLQRGEYAASAFRIASEMAPANPDTFGFSALTHLAGILWGVASVEGSLEQARILIDKAKQLTPHRRWYIPAVEAAIAALLEWDWAKCDRLLVEANNLRSPLFAELDDLVYSYLMSQHHFEAALMLLARRFRQASNNLSFKVRAAETYICMGRLTEAEKILLPLDQMDRSNGEIKLALAHLCEARGHPDQATKVMLSMTSPDEFHVAFFAGLAGEHSLSLKLFEELRKKQETGEFVFGRRLGMMALANGKIDEAVDWMIYAIAEQRDVCTFSVNCLPCMRHLWQVEAFSQFITERLKLPLRAYPSGRVAVVVRNAGRGVANSVSSSHTVSIETKPFSDHLTGK